MATAWPTAAAANSRSRALYAKGLVPFHAQRWEEALRLFDAAVQEDAQDALATYYRGLSAARLGLIKEATRDIDRAAQLRPDLPGAALDLGILHFEAEAYADAEDWLQRAYQQPRDRFAAALFLGLSRFRRGDDAGARTFFEEAARDPAVRASAQYYGALARLRLGQTDEARHLLEQVPAEQPDSEIGQAARQYLETVPAARWEAGAPEGGEAPWVLHGTVGFAYDSNVVLAPDDAAIKDSRSISRESDGRAVVAFGGRYRLLDTASVVGNLSYDLSQSVHFRLTDFDLQGHRVRLDVATRPARLQYGLTGLYDFYALDYRSFFHEGIGTPWATLFEGQVSATQVYYSFRSRDFFREPFDPFRDSFNQAVGLRQFFLLGEVGRVLSIGYQLDDEDPISTSGNDFEYVGHQFDANVAFGLRDWTRGVVGYLLRFEDYQFRNSRTGTGPRFGVRRHDKEHQLVVHFDRPLVPHLSANLEYFGTLNDSNIPAFEYDRHVVSLGVRLEF